MSNNNAATTTAIDAQAAQSGLADNLWRNNPAFIQMLGLCPLLAVSSTLVNSIGLSLATLFAVTLSNILISSTREYLRPEIRIPVFVLLIAGIVTITDMLMNAWLPGLHATLGIFVPLIITNCAIIARAEMFASRKPVNASIRDGLSTGLGFMLALCLLGAVRELIGQGTLLANAHLLFGEQASNWGLTLAGHYPGLLLVALPPGAFITLGCLLAISNYLKQRTRSATRADQ